MGVGHTNSSSIFVVISMLQLKKIIIIGDHMSHQLCHTKEISMQGRKKIGTAVPVVLST